MKIFQQTACYRKPFAFQTETTYPLPPYSTVKGMLHKILDAKKFIPMSISVQGEKESSFIDYQYKYIDKGNKTVRKPVDVHYLYNLNLIIHIKAEKEILEKIVEGIVNNNETLNLGRKEDHIIIEEIKLIDVIEKNIEEEINGKIIEIPIYVPANKKPEYVNGITYNLTWKYKIIAGIRQWDKIKTKYINSNQMITEDNYLEDADGDLVYFNV